MDRDRSVDLFLNLAEQVKLPFLQIAHAAEMMEKTSTAKELERSRTEVSLASKSALNLIDGYLLSVKLQREGQLQLEPVSISSVLYDTAQNLEAYAKAHECRLEIDLAGKYAPVMAHRQAVQAALLSHGDS